MKVTYNWLKEYVDFDWSVEELGERITMLGVEVEGIEETGGAFEGAFGGPSISFGDIAAAGGPGAQWDALPAEAKIQIICAVGFLEVIGELSPVLEANGEKHYVKGGKPGYYPPIAGRAGFGQVTLNLWDPFNLVQNNSAEKKARGLKVEILNGRAAMMGILGMMVHECLGVSPFFPQTPL